MTTEIQLYIYLQGGFVYCSLSKPPRLSIVSWIHQYRKISQQGCCQQDLNRTGRDAGLVCMFQQKLSQFSQEWGIIFCLDQDKDLFRSGKSSLGLVSISGSQINHLGVGDISKSNIYVLSLWFFSISGIEILMSKYHYNANNMSEFYLFIPKHILLPVYTYSFHKRLLFILRIYFSLLKLYMKIYLVEACRPDSCSIHNAGN